MYEINRNAPIEYMPRARMSEFPTSIARGDTEFRSQEPQFMGVYALIKPYAGSPNWYK